MAAATTFAEANTTSKESAVIKEDSCVNVTLSCGVSGCVQVTSMDMLLDHIEFAEAYWCD